MNVMIATSEHGAPKQLLDELGFQWMYDEEGSDDKKDSTDEPQDSIGPIRRRKKIKAVTPYSAPRRSSRLRDKQLRMSQTTEPNDTQLFVPQLNSTTTNGNSTSSEDDKKTKSSLAKHESETGHKIDRKNFDVIDHDNHSYYLLVKESLMIKKLQPKLNCTTHSVPMIIFPE
ncbi:unnamed protein product, partial [Didymodactylos carnosus]